MVSLWLRGAALVTLITGTLAWDADSIRASRKPIEASGPAIIPGKFIVELEPGTSLQSRDIGRRGSALIGEIESLGYDASVAEDLTSASGGFQAVSVKINNDGNMTLGELKDVPGVVDAWPVYAITLDVEFDTNNASPQWNPHEVTRVDELHRRGIKGKGQRVCVVDSGADASHPVLSGRIAGGKNMLDDSTDIQDCNGHGTFVSSVIVGQSKDFVGVAPEAEVYMYKVFGCDGSTPNDIVLKGMLAADADDCDIVSLSLGLDNGYSGSVMSRVASEIAERRLVIIAAGNSGEQGVFYASSPASGRGVVSVASVNSKKVLGWPATLASSSGETLELRYVTPDGQKLNESTSVPLQFDESDSCDPTLYGSEDEAVLIKRGICFSGKAYNYLSSTGFGYFLIFDSYNQGVFYDSEITVSPEVHLWATIDASVGEWVKKQVASGRNITLEVEADADAEVSEQDYPSAGQVSAFSSWGLTFENDFSPSIAAPGGAVYGAFPNNDYAIASGTSFSTPYMSGLAALFFSSKKKDGEEFFRRIASTAALLPSYDAAMGEVVSEIASLAQQGAGLVDAVKLMDYETVLVSEPLIALNDTDNRVKTHTITLRNTGSEAVTYQVSHVAAATVQSRDEYWYPLVYYPPVLQGQGSIEAPDSITIAAGATRDVQVTINPPDVESDSGALWSGKIVFQGSNDEFVTVPYMGVEVSTYNWTPLEGAPLPFRYDSNDGYLYPINWKNLPYRPDELESPEIYYALRYGTYEFSLDLVGEDWTVDDFEYPFIAGASSKAWSGSLRGQPDVFGNYVNFPITFPVRFSNVGFTRFQSFSNGTAIPSGKYKILSRALRMFGNPNKAEDWQLFLSDAFSIQLGDDPIPGQTSTSATTESLPTSTVASLSETITPSTTTSEVTTTSDVAVETTSSIPGITTTLTAKSTPTGLSNAFVDVSLARQGTQSRTMNAPGDWMELHVQILIPNRVPADTVVSFALPAEIVDVAEKAYVMDQGSNLVGTSSFDEETSVFSVTLNDWTEWHKNMVGDFYLYCRFSEELQADLQAGTYFIEIATVGEKFYPPIYYSAIDRTKVYEFQSEKTIDDRPIYQFDIEVPGQLGPWNSVTFVASQASTDDGFLCDGTSVVIGTEFDHENKITKSRDITAEAVQRCQVKTFRSKYTGEVAKDEVLAFRIANMLGIKGSWTIDMSYSLAIELTNGTTVGFDVRTLQHAIFARSRPDNFFSAEVDRPVPGVSTTESASLTTLTPTLSTTTYVSTEATTDATTTSFETTETPTRPANTTFSTSSETTSETSSFVLPTTTEESSVTSSDTTFALTTGSSTGSSTVPPSNETTTTSTIDYTSSVSSLESSETDISTSVSESTYTYPTTTESDPASTTTDSVSTLETSQSEVPTSESTNAYTTTTPSVSDVSSSASSLESSQAGISTESEHTYPVPSSPSQSSEGTPDSSSTSSTHGEAPGYTSLPSHATSSRPGVVTETHAVTVITSVCSDPSWTAPVTVTYTVPCVTSGVESVTTVTSVCKKCAEHPVTITYTQPVQVTHSTLYAHSTLDVHPTSDGPFTKSAALHSASQIQYQGSSVTIPGPRQSQPAAGADGKGHSGSTAPSNVDAPVVSAQFSTQVREVPTTTPDSEGDHAAGNGEHGGSGDAQGSGQAGNQAPAATSSTTTLSEATALSEAATEPPTSAPTMVVVEGRGLRLGIDGWKIALGAFSLAFMLTF
ncbi:uncharacterized protein NECHADRAFT_84201 [Fusarium vanettenii 77-13-4]|uniref:Peptidase S8/S53 domain-containing protein n=1 Tax=Fusarium vanettenii (strain ATCC MYA-4622 / CBS 123669 / FGSC 9596 / NRRL 45880 / 77-13-4) TaxID=660122 RepID=C7Z000_FUSV7|nr:uncharacterized protein NECHADRAFT_84201 [Fusarium vanettenii 77-13-4]EEU42701.1 hypothetical protein NECHADRAFT_84201 [Fusarium vanettenii 77-13-4]